MKSERLQYLINEYRLVQKRLYEIRADYERMKITFEILKEVEKELGERAKHASDGATGQYWMDIAAGCFTGDQDRPNEADFNKAKEKVEKNEKLILYYETKLNMIRRFLGVRETDLFESFQEKNILMGSEQSSSTNMRNVLQKTEEEDKLRDERKNDVNFNKM
ncbi:MAG: hypothetical protein WCI77_03815 [Candidatus Omnitrophota bacterium]